MSNMSPELPKHDILALIKSAEAQKIPPEHVFPAPFTVEATGQFVHVLPAVDYVSEAVKSVDYKTSRNSSMFSKIGLMVIGGAIFAAGSYTEEISTVLSKQSSVIPAVQANENYVTIAESPSLSPSPSHSASPSPSPIIKPSPTSIKIPNNDIVKQPPVKPSAKPSPKPTAPSFNQAKFGRMKQYAVIEKDFDIIAKEVSRISHDYYKPLTLARFNGIKDARSVRSGDKLAYRDCPTNGILVNVDDTVSQLAEKYGTSTAKLHELNGGAARAVAGWCLRLKLVTTESYSTSPVRK